MHLIHIHKSLSYLKDTVTATASVILVDGFGPPAVTATSSHDET